jgi:hypothetical protein
MLIEEENPTWVKTLLSSYDWDDIGDIAKLFNYDLHEIYKQLEKKNLEIDFLDQVSNWDDDNRLMHIINMLGGSDKILRGLAETDLVYKYIIDDLVRGFDADDAILEVKEDNKIYLTMDKYSKVLLFVEDYTVTDDNCSEIAKLVFNGALWENWTDYPTRPSVEEMVDGLTQENYRTIIADILNEFQEQPITCPREEFIVWVEEDGLSDDEFYVNAQRFNYFLDPNTDRYNFSVRLECSGELSGYVDLLNSTYNNAFNSILLDNYYNVYHRSVEEIVGKPVGTTKTYDYRRGKKIELDAEVYDITKIGFSTLIGLASAGGYNDYGMTDFLQNLAGGGICPEIYDDDYNEDDFIKRYNEFVNDTL